MIISALLLILVSQPTLLDQAHRLLFAGDSAAAETLLLSAPPSVPAEQPLRLLMLANLRMDRAEFHSARGLYSRIANHPFTPRQIVAVAQSRILQTFLLQGENTAALHHLDSLRQTLYPEPVLLALAAMTDSINHQPQRAHALLQQLLPLLSTEATDSLQLEAGIAAAQAAAKLVDPHLALEFFQPILPNAQRLFGPQSWRLFPFLLAQIQLANQLRLPALRDDATAQLWPLLATHQESHQLLTPPSCATLRSLFSGPRRKQIHRWCAALPQNTFSQTVAASVLRPRD